MIFFQKAKGDIRKPEMQSISGTDLMLEQISACLRKFRSVPVIDNLSAGQETNCVLGSYQGLPPRTVTVMILSLILPAALQFKQRQRKWKQVEKEMGANWERQTEGQKTGTIKISTLTVMKCARQNMRLNINRVTCYINKVLRFWIFE